MKRDVIKKVEIDTQGRLNISPGEQKFTMIYRTATQVHWDSQNQNLYSPKPSDWTYVDWYNHIIRVARQECFCELSLTKETVWINVPENIKNEIIQVQ